MSQQNSLQGVLFDLDGTLADTAPDMVGALNILCREFNRAEISFEIARPHVSHGSKALVDLGFPEAEEAEAASMIRRFLSIYADNLCVNTQLFKDMDSVLDHLEQQRIPWGIVTNKPAFLTDPLIEKLALSQRAGCVVSGDTVAERKPHAMPLLHACTLMQVDSRQCLYVGDAERDITAGRAAGMRTLAAGYGYIVDEDNPSEWQADGIIMQPLEILNWLQANPADSSTPSGPATNHGHARTLR